MKIPRRTRRKVRFGNPAMGTTHVGWVHTVEGGENTSKSQMVAMVDVPPEEVPEGALNLARSHRPYIEHVRILITSPETSNRDEPNTLINLENNINGDSASQKFAENQTDTETVSTLTPLESAASILALEEEEEELHKKNRKSFLIIFSLLDSTSATDFVNDLHGKPYTTLEPDITCSVYTIETLECIITAPIFSSSLSHKNVQHLSQTNNGNNDHLISKNNDLKDINENEESVQVPSETLNCAVCLEKMEFPSMSSTIENTVQQQQHGGDAIITTVCNHSFHVDCLLGWQDSPCPVCRYDGGLTNEESLLSKCHLCGTTENNYICLICGVVSCSATTPSSPLPSSTSYAASATSSYTTSTSRIDDNCDSCTESQNCHVSPSTLPPDSHAVQHYNETLHAYALDTRTQHVWDFCGQGYVHRLLQNSQDGKLVEVHDPTNTNSHVRSSHPRYLTDAQEDFMVHAKLEGFANQYYNLLKSQLESQRSFYEERLEYIEKERISSKKKKNSNSSSTANLITALKQEKHQLEQRCLTLRQKYRQMSREVIDLKSMNESLETGKKQFRMKIIEAQRNRTEAKNMFTQCLPPLEEKVASLIMELELEPGDEQQNQKSQKTPPSSCNSSDDSKKPASRRK